MEDEVKNVENMMSAEKKPEKEIIQLVENLSSENENNLNKKSGL
jgi:hypothetical protein